MQNDKHSSNLQLYSNIISFQNILFRSYSNKKSFSTLQKPNSKQQAIKNCLLLPSPLEPQRQLSHKNSSLLRAHSLPDGSSRTPQTTTSPKFTPHLPIKDYPPHQISLMREIISLKVHFIQDSSSRVEPLQGIKTPSQLLLLGTELNHFVEQAGQQDHVHSSSKNKKNQSCQDVPGAQAGLRPKCYILCILIQVHLDLEVSGLIGGRGKGGNGGRRGDVGGRGKGARGVGGVGDGGGRSGQCHGRGKGGLRGWKCQVFLQVVVHLLLPGSRQGIKPRFLVQVLK